MSNYSFIDVLFLNVFLSENICGENVNIEIHAASDYKKMQFWFEYLLLIL